jgi:hypothetical protein
MENVFVVQLLVAGAIVIFFVIGLILVLGRVQPFDRLPDFAGVDSPARNQLLQIVAVAVSWVLAFELNKILSPALAVNEYVSWIFLPAAVRILAVMQFGWRGVAGLFIGAMLTNSPIAGIDLPHVLAISLLSALGPMIAVAFCVRLFKVSSDIRQLDGLNLYAFATAGAFFNATSHCLYFWLRDPSVVSLSNFFPMFLGDMVGTAIVFCLISIVWKRSFRIHLR